MANKFTGGIDRGNARHICCRYDRIWNRTPRDDTAMEYASEVGFAR